MTGSWFECIAAQLPVSGTPEEVRELFENYKDNLFVVLDGLDEILDGRQQELLMQFVQERLGGVSAIVTSRYVEYLNRDINPAYQPGITPTEQQEERIALLESIPRFDLQGMTARSVVEYIRGYNRMVHGGLEGEKQTLGFFVEIAKRTYIRPLLRNVTFLEQACVLFDKHGSLPKSLESFVQVFLEDSAEDFESIASSEKYKNASSDMQEWIGLLAGQDLKSAFTSFVYGMNDALTGAGDRCVSFDSVVGVVQQSFDTSQLSGEEVEKVTRSVLYFSPLFVDYGGDQHGFINYSLKDPIGVMQALDAVNTRREVELFNQYVKTRDIGIQRFYFTCLATRSDKDKQFEQIFKRRMVDLTTVVPYAETVLEQGIRLPDDTRNRTIMMLYGTNEPVLAKRLT